MLSSLEIKKNLGFGGSFALLLMAMSLVGCTQQEQITSYRVRKPEQVDPTLVSTASASAAPTTDQQTVGLIIPVDETGWFFKLTGDAKAVEPQHETFLEFAQSIKFSSPPD